jgi:RNA polymerase sigma factor (sigma-70 family)
LVARAKSGETAAYEQLVRCYQRLAFRVAYVITGDADEAEDVAQTAFVNAYLALPRFRPGAPFRPWLLRIVANEARNRGLAAARRRRFVLALGADEAARTADPPDTAVVAAEERAWLLAHLDRLREEDRTILTLRYILELPEAEIAAALGCRRGTVKSRLHRALGRLRTQVLAEAHPTRGDAA